MENENTVSAVFPLVSVLIPAYNHQQYVRQAIESVLNQTYENIELIVIDDGSKDNTREVIEKISEEREDSFLFITRANSGLIKTMKEGFSYMHGEYFSLLASDDYWDKKKIEEQVNFMQQDKNIVMSFTEYYNIDEKSNKYTIIKLPDNNRDYRFIDVLEGHVFPPASVMTRKSLIENIQYPSDINHVEDLYLWLYILQQGGYARYIHQPLVYYRMHGNNTMDRIPAEMSTDIYNTIKYFSNNLKCQKRILSKWALRSADHLSRNYKRESFYYLLKCIDRFYNPIFIKAIIKLLFF